MATTQFVVGPILGLEGDDRYTVIVLLDTTVKVEDLVVRLADGNAGDQWAARATDGAEKTANYQLVRFAFQIPGTDQSKKITYALFEGDRVMANRAGETEWAFVVPGAATVPKIGFASCNGDAKKLPDELPDSAFVMWRRLLDMHEYEGGEGPLDYAFHALLLGGDQVYADPLWHHVSYLADRWFIRFRRSRFVRHHKIPPEQRDRFHRELSEFYEGLYIETFGQHDVAAVLARIPTCMLWDDHDIVDGWGSYPDAIQHSDILKEIGEVATRYFELFQLRTRANRSRPLPGDFSQHFRFRNFELILLDNRMHRTPKRIMAEDQYAYLNKAKEALFDGLTPPLDEERVLLFLVPVPVAHLDYKKQTESLIARLFRWMKTEGSFTKSIEDDLLDHWNHEQHEDEHLRFINVMFEMAEHSGAKYLHMVSGDVHSAGGGRIERIEEPQRYANQLVASPIVYEPVGRFVQWVLSKAANLQARVEGYRVGVHPFGFDDSKLMNVYERNFGFLYKPKGAGLRFYLSLENQEPMKPKVTQPRLFRADPALEALRAEGDGVPLL